LFLGDRNPSGKYYKYNASTLALGWTGPALSDLLTSSPIVATFVYGTAGAGDGKFHAFSKTDGNSAFVFPPASATPTTIGAASPPTLGSDNVIYFSDDAKTFYAILYTTGTEAGFAPGWGQTMATSFKGSATTPDTSLDSVTTEPTLDANGVLYFGTQAGKVYALISDSLGPLAPTAGSTWPRVGYDNCNSSNTTLNCQ
jgi:outer membrane protein assembly factor BamB